MYTDSKILKSLFYIQLFSSFLVVVGHFTASVLYFNDPFWIVALNQISRYGTVLLTIATGYLTAYSFDKKQPAFREFFTGKIIYIVIPFLVSGVLYHYLLKNGMPHSLRDYANIVLGKTGDHLYFVFMICQYYVAAYFLRNIITKRNILYVIWILLAVQYVYIHYIHQGWLGLTTRHMLPTWIFTLYMGHLIYWYREWILSFLRNNRSILMLVTGVSTAAAIYFVISNKLYVAVHLTFVFATLLSFLVLMVFFLELVDHLHIKFRKGLTYFIFLFHSAFLILFKDLLYQVFGEVSWIFQNTWYSLLYLAAIFVCSAVFAILLVRLVKRLENAWASMGRIRKERLQ
ncbi:acyltransferase [Brevibacillus choshinensis]|uniref:acyltransferase n=1 Tax=Brevibacillus choshinensis TaxID=54911 RepID=UPI002E23B020|nr:acyltransferase [Brevibacillus choshinensis]MED4752342.1 acyltransferase [Brevibacillus choshinensis]MED4783819.1 acyltransferase [Brevibacillus choshinensis]